MSDDTLLYIDDTFPLFSYSDGWFDNADVSTGLNLKGAFNDTLSSTTTVGATFQYSFTASQIAVIGATQALPGAKSDSGPLSAYVIDGARNSAFFYQANLTNATVVPFFVSGALSGGLHTLEIVVVDVTPETPFYLDAILLGQPQGVQTVTAIWATTKIITPSAAIATSTLLAGSAAKSDSSMPTGAIVGGVVGGVALLVAAVLAFYFLYWRKRHYGYHGFSRDALFDADMEKEHLASNAVPPAEHAEQIEPFLAPSSAPQFTEYSDTPSASELSSSAAGVPHTYPPPGSVGGRSASTSASGSGRTLSVVNPDGAALSPAQRKAQEAKQGSQPPGQPVQYHADSGARFDGQGRPIEAGGSGTQDADAPPLADVPPEYSET
ncbi:hypothetical protein K466DRAFT_509630 [Polyporus arcularius HHB13444]|uniref:Transmembrane protein n=1 Tax=Polyporus arcularius HHB13444 TaxID=1314778 RepID=A0A5C3Q217_9APHY|nr:hypothetical protein K466DRAFT_509630 [Polyporus arcularius HHB13444]